MSGSPFSESVESAGRLTVIVRTPAADSLAASVTCTVKLKTPAADGVPAIAPVDEFKERPVGSEPLVTVHEYGAWPPVAAKVVV